MIALPVQEWTPPFQTEATCHVTPSTHSLFHEQNHWYVPRIIDLVWPLILPHELWGEI